MPSYIRPRKHFTRYEILLQLRDRSMRRNELEKFFERITDVIPLSRQKKEISPGFTQATIRLVKPKLSQRKFAQFLYSLKRDGLIKEDEKDNSTFSITDKAKTVLRKFIAKPHLAIPEYANNSSISKQTTIISYDIPERLRAHRDWLRIVLSQLSFTQMQRSVWIGKIKLPTDFIADIVRFKLEKFIEIFEITKTGTLRHRL